MKAMLLRRLGPIERGREPMDLADIPEPEPEPAELLLRVRACGVCHTELDEIEGRAPPPRLPVVLGHQVVGEVARLPDDRKAAYQGLREGDRVGVAWIFSACGDCEHCRRGAENLCPHFVATGRDRDGGYAETMSAPAAFVYPIPDNLTDTQAAPLLCAGAIGYRSLALAGLENGQSLGLTGFGASAHLLLQVVRHHYPATAIFVFARSEKQRAFARQLGAHWAGATEESPPEKLHCIVDTTPAWGPMVAALAALRPGGRLVINAIRKEPFDQQALLALDYPKHLWQEKQIQSVANVTRRDVREFLSMAAEIEMSPEVELYPLEDANRALEDLKFKSVRGAKVLEVG